MFNYFFRLFILEKELAEAEAKEEAGKSKLKGALPPEPIKPSFQAKELLETLEFNEVDMYRSVHQSTAPMDNTKFTKLNSLTEMIIRMWLKSS